MKIQCDVCEKKEAAVFCSADEASLCEGCDKRVHHANKLAGKHHRFTLVHPSCNHAPPLCDVCQVFADSLAFNFPFMVVVSLLKKKKQLFINIS